jgi:PAS domain S-box-containing protein
MDWPVDSLKILTESFIFIGATIMLFAIVYTRNIFRHQHAHKYNRRWRLMFALMLLFLLSYITIFLVAYHNQAIIFAILTSIVFLFGSVFVYLSVRASFFTINDLGHYINDLTKSLLEQEQLETTLAQNRVRLLRQNDLLFFLTKNVLKKQNLEASLQLLAEKTAELLDVERVGIWLFDKDRTYIECIELFELRETKHTKGHKLYKKDYPAYFEALEKDGVIDASNALVDERTKEYSISYLKPLGILSMLDAPIHIDGKLYGVLCNETIGQARHWTAEEQSFAAALTDIIAITIETFRRTELTEELTLREGMFRSAFEYSGIGMALVSPEGRWLKVNKELCHIVGYSEDELLTKTFQDITHPDDLEADLQLVKQTLSGQRDTYSMEKRYFHKNGSILWINLTVSLVRDKNRQPLFFISQIENVTERKQTRRALEISLSLTKATIESSADGILVVDNTKGISDYNQQFLKVWQMPVNLIKDPKHFDLMEFAKAQVVNPQKFEARVHEIYAHPAQESKDLIFFTDGRVFERYSKPQIANNEIVGRVWSFRDVTQQKRTEEEIKTLNADLEDRVIQRTAEIKKLNEELRSNVQNLEVANKDLESFSYTVSHDLRAPLRSVTSFTSLLLQKNPTLDAESKQFLTIISNNAKKMDQLIEDLLAFSRLGKRDVEKVDLDMNELVRDVLAGINIQEWNANTKVNVNDLLPAYGDPNLIKQVFFNLIANAVKYSRPKPDPLIEIGSFASGAENTYYVKDNGVGFSMEYYDKLFKVFQRMHSISEFEGTGVGLAIVHRIVMKHGGKVWAEAAKDKGAAFYFTLPVVAATPAASAPASGTV